MTSRFVETWRAVHPDGEIVHRDLATTSLPAITDDWPMASTDLSHLTSRQREYLATSDELIAEVLAADLIVLGAPMYNFTVSAELKAWIDQVVRVGKTVAYGADGPKGLLKGKRVIVVTSRGGTYPSNTSRAGSDFQEPYLRKVLGFIGITDLTFIHADNQMRGALADASRIEALERIDSIARAAGEVYQS
jgi:FMN-dependent NADH-azoreductase